jgi:hypothetical protein
MGYHLLAEELMAKIGSGDKTCLEGLAFVGAPGKDSRTRMRRRCGRPLHFLRSS